MIKLLEKIGPALLGLGLLAVAVALLLRPIVALAAAGGGGTDWKVADVYDVTATATAQSITPTNTLTRAYVITQKSANKAHLEPTGAAAGADGVNGITLEGSVDAAVFIEPNGAAGAAMISYIRDTSATGNATLEVQELVK